MIGETAPHLCRPPFQARIVPWLRVLALLILVTLMLAPPLVGEEAPALEPQTHPNHYILVVDSSGSIQGRSSLLHLEHALKSLVNRLHGNGFGPVPAYDPERDLLSLHHWGIVDTGSEYDAIDRLRHYDLGGIIHPRIVRRSGISREMLATALRPQASYRLSFLSLSEEVALDASRPPSSSTESHRTFLLKVDDREANGASVCDERDDLEKGRPLHLGGVLAKVDGIGERYELRRMYTEEFPADGDGQVFLGVYEARRRDFAEWAGQLTWSSPFDESRLVWEDESRNGATGILTVRLEEGIKRLGISGIVEVAGEGLAGRAEWAPAQGTELRVPVRREGRLSCGTMPVEVTFRATPRRQDELLGQSAYTYEARRALVAPPPSRCSLPSRVRRGVLWSFLASVLLLGMTSVGIRSFGTPLWAKLPGVSRLVGLEWDGPIDHRVSLAIHPGKQLVRLHLPPFLIQFLAYYGAVLSVDGPVARGLRWNDRTDPGPVRLPIRARTLSLLWTENASEDGWAEITFKTGGRAARLRLGRTPTRQGTES